MSAGGAGPLAPLETEKVLKYERAFGDGLTYESAESVLTAHGVVAALALAFVVGAQYVTTPDQNFKVDFQSLICSYGEFRQYVVTVMEAEDVGKYKNEAFNFTVASSKGASFNIKEQLLVSWQFNDAVVVNSDRPFSFSDSGAIRECLADPDVSSAVALLVDDFPKKMMNHWKLHHQPVYTWTYTSDYYLSIATALLLGSLVFSIFQLVGLSLSGVQSPDPPEPGDQREDIKAVESLTQTTSEALKGWFKLNIAFIVMDYICLIAGLVLTFMGQSRYIVAQSILVTASWQAQELCLIKIVLPLAIAGFASVVASVAVTLMVQVKKNEIEDLNDELGLDEYPDAEGEGTTSTSKLLGS